MTETQQAETAAAPVDDSTPDLNAALAAVQAELPRIEKGKTATVPTKAGGQYTYTYADLADVSAQILPLLGKNGLSFTTWPTLTGNRLVLRYELLHASGQSKAGAYPLPIDAGAQALGSAITYARRYCLCAVTGVSPDDDDDAATADAKVAAGRAAEKAEQDKERDLATQSVMGAWANQFGGWDPQAATVMFSTWSKGGEVATATPKQLRAFTGYLLALPAADAGSQPATEPAAAQGEVREVTDEKLSKRDNAHMFVLFEKLGMKDDHTGQREYLGRVLERQIASRGEVRQADWPNVRRALEADVQIVEKSGLALTQPQEGDAPIMGVFTQTRAES